MFSHECQSVLALVDFVLIQMWKFSANSYSHGDLTVEVLSLGSFVLGIAMVYVEFEGEKFGNWPAIC